jgi:excinuclease ABC subunit A
MIARSILKEIHERLSFMVNVGLDYLTLDRTAGTLSGGEAQRIRLATQIGSQLMGVLYVLDEPSIGLHQRDNARLIRTCKGCATWATPSWWWSMTRTRCARPTGLWTWGRARAGRRLVVAEGPPELICANEGSLTGAYLSGRMRIPLPQKRRKGHGRVSHIAGRRKTI